MWLKYNYYFQYVTMIKAKFQFLVEMNSGLYTIESESANVFPGTWADNQDGYKPPRYVNAWIFINTPG